MVYPVAEHEIFELLEPFSTGAGTGDLTLETRLFADLGIDGDDGHGVLDSLAALFHVDMTGVNSFCYFDDEPPKITYSEFTWLAGLLSERFRDYVEDCLSARKEVTVGDLYVSARLRRWDFPEQPRADAEFSSWGEAQVKQLLFHLVGGLLIIGAAIFFESWNLSLTQVIVILALLWLASAIIRFAMELRWLKRLKSAKKAAEKRI